MAWSRGSKLCGLGLIAFTIVVFLLPWWVPKTVLTLDPGAIRHDRGFAYIIPLHIPDRLLFVFPSDVEGGGYKSTLVVLENGHPLGPAHAVHEDIRLNGDGRFSHWDRSLYFSTGDRSDPRTNGRRYTVAVAAKLSPAIAIGILTLDLAFIVLMRKALIAAARKRRVLLTRGIAAAAVLIASLTAVGVFGGAHPDRPADLNLVVAVVLHALLGVVVTLAQWVMGAGVARAILPKHGTSYPQVVLLGFPLSLIGLAILVSVALIAPFGGVLAVGLAILCIWPLIHWPLEPAHLRDLIRRLPAMILLSAAFGCWLALQWHGPTDTLQGFPTGDLTFYASSTWAMASHPLGRPYLGNEGEYASYFNMLIPALGAALRSAVPIDGFLFILTTAGIASLLGTALAIHAYATARPSFALRSLEGGALLLCVVVAGRYPYWVAESPPAAHVVPLTIAVWFWTVESLRNKATPLIGVALAFFGTALTKVTAFFTLGLLTLAVSARLVRRLSRPVLVALGLLFLVSAAYSAMMLVQYLPFFVQLASFSPESYESFVKYGAGFWSSWPYLARDIGCAFLALAAIWIVPWPASAAVVLGICCAAVFPFAMRINYVCAVIVIGLAAVDEPARLRASRLITFSGLLLCLPAMLLTDSAGESMGLGWFAIAASIIFVSVPRYEAGAAATASFELGLLVRTASVVIVLALVALARGVLPYTQHLATDPLTPQLRDIWKEVRELSSTDSLVFTDQVGHQPTLLGGWNTYALHGQRQVYHANWYQSMLLRNNPEQREMRLNTNDDVLSGRLAPADAMVTRKYNGFYAVVSTNRQMDAHWHRIYANDAYSLYEWGK